MKKITKEQIAEDCCFHCKDGGLLLICDYKDCLKAYHPICVGKDDFFLESQKRWVCGWHSCFACQKSSKFYCYCCPKGVCGWCINVAEFAHVRGNKGFCSQCLKLALLIEENNDVDSDGGKVDFHDKTTFEFLFMEYWMFTKERDKLSLADLHAANSMLKNHNFKANIDADDKVCCDENEDLLVASDYDDVNDTGFQNPVSRGKSPNYQKSRGQKHLKNKKMKMEFIGWGSRPLIEFLASIGKDTSSKLSQYEATSVINEYICENMLFDPNKKKRIMCDARLFSVFGRKLVNKNKIYDLLESHFAENLEQLDEDELGCGSGDKHENFLIACKRPRVPNSNRKSQYDMAFTVGKKGSFAWLVEKNLQLVYLRRSLIMHLLKQPDTFEGKAIGSFVRVKSDPNDYMQKNSHQLVQVTGVKNSSDNEKVDVETLLQVTNVQTNISISMLSDDQFSEEECQDLRRRVKDGLLKRPTVVEFQQKAQILHEDITKHWIMRELALLQNLIDQANEKGWRKELFEYIDRRRLLQTTSEQLRLLRQVPEVMSDTSEVETAAEQAHGDPSEDTSEGRQHEEENQQWLGLAKPSLGSQYDFGSDTIKNDIEEEKEQCFGGQNQQQLQVSGSGESCERKAIGSKEVVVLSDDDGVKIESEGQVEMDKNMWYCVGPRGDRKGPLSLSILRRWNESSLYASKYKVWKMCESEDAAVWLTEAISRAASTKP